MGWGGMGDLCARAGCWKGEKRAPVHTSFSVFWMFVQSWLHSLFATLMICFMMLKREPTLPPRVYTLPLRILPSLLNATRYSLSSSPVTIFIIPRTQ
jgi:hypothetical protein